MGILLIGIPVTFFLLGFLSWIVTSWLGWVLTLVGGTIVVVGTALYVIDRIGWVIPAIALGLALVWWLVHRIRAFAIRKTNEEVQDA